MKVRKVRDEYGKIVREVETVPGLNIFDYREWLEEWYPGAHSQFHMISEALEMPSTILFVEVWKRKSRSWSGSANSWANPLREFSQKGVRYKVSEPVFKCKVRVGCDMSPAWGDVHGGVVGTRTGRGTLLFLVAHEFVHLLSNSKGIRRSEKEVSAVAREACVKLFPEEFHTAEVVVVHERERSAHKSRRRAANAERRAERLNFKRVVATPVEEPRERDQRLR